MFDSRKRSAVFLLLLALIVGLPVGMTLSVPVHAAQPTARIVGGDVVRDARYPFMVAVFFDVNGSGNFTQGCGGTLISDRWVLTAAHCVVDASSGQQVSPIQVSVLVGALNIFVEDDGALLGARNIVVNPEYIPQTFSNDIALIELSRTVDFSVIALPAAGSDVPEVGENAVVTGWGHTTEGGLKSGPLRQVSLPVISHARCLPFYARSLSVNRNVCAGGAIAGGRDSCQGDSGGPLFVVRDGVFVQAGIVSFGEGCARPGIPGVYTRLNNYTDWVASIVPDVVINNSGVGIAEPDQPISADPQLTQLTVEAPILSGSLLTGEVAIYEVTNASRVELNVVSGDADLIVTEGAGFEVDDVVCRSENLEGLDACDLSASDERRFALVFAYSPSDYNIGVEHTGTPEFPTPSPVPDNDGEGSLSNDGTLSGLPIAMNDNGGAIGSFGLWLLGVVLGIRRLAVLAQHMH